MKPLKRPMFRTGGPIKEGLMNGLKDGGPATYMADATMMAGGGMPNMRGRVTGPGGYAGKKESFLKRNYGKLMTAGGAAYNAPEILEMLRFFYKDGGVASLPPMRGMVTGPGKYSQDAMKGFGGALKGGLKEDIEQRIKKNPTKAVKPGTYVVPAIKAGVRKYLPSLEGIGGKTMGGIKNLFRKIEMPSRRIFTGMPPGTNLSSGQIAAGMATRPATFFERVNMFRKANPKTFYGTLPFGVSGAITTGAGLGPPAIDLGKKALLQVADLAVPDLIFDQDKYFAEKKAKEEIEKNKNQDKGRDLNIQQSGGTKQGDPTKEELDKQKLDRIYKLLGVKKAQANAASKALIDMSRYIDEGGKDVISKKNIGSTISKAISAFDKRLDKADQLKEAAGLMVAKGIANEGDIDKKYKQVMIDAKLKELNPTILDQKLALDLKGQTLTHDRTKTIAKRTFPNAIVLADASDAKDAGVGDTITAEEYVKEQVKTQGGDVAGVYIVDKSVIQVDAQGNTKQLL